MSLTQEEAAKLNELRLVELARTIDATEANVKQAEARKALNDYISTLYTGDWKTAPIGAYVCLRCGGPVTIKGYCARCSSSSTAMGIDR